MRGELRCSRLRLGAAATGAWLLLAAACGVEQPRVDTGWSEACPIEIQTRVREPIHEWADCSPESGVTGCRSLVARGRVTPDPKIRSTTGRGMEIAYGQSLAPVRGAADEGIRRQWIWAGVDGEVRVLVAQPRPEESECTFYVEELREDGLRLAVRGDGRGPLAESLADGLLHLGRDGSARVLYRNDDREVSSWNGDLRRVAPERRLERHALGSAEDGAVQVVHDPAVDPGGLGVGVAPPVDADGTLFFEVGDARTRAVLSWTAENGSRAIRRYEAREGRSAGNLGSDGELLVWTDAEGQDEAGGFAETWIEVASISFPDGARRIARDEGVRVGATPFAVGCGWAGHRVPGGALFVDLATGETMHLDDGDTLRWGNVLAISCDEVFVSYVGAGPSSGGPMKLARLPRAELRAFQTTS